jgi:hypothetical protein
MPVEDSFLLRSAWRCLFKHVLEVLPLQSHNASKQLAASISRRIGDNSHYPIRCQ